MKPVFTLANASAKHGDRVVLAGVTLTIYAGEKVALVGESGAGKSTLLALLRAQNPAGVAWCPQASGLVPVLSVFHNIYMGRIDRHSTLHNLRNLLRPVAADVTNVGAVADQLGLREKLFTSVDRLSGGQQQRVAVGRALYSARDIFLGDEPVSAVDEFQADDIVRAITASHATVVLALHDIALALAHTDRVIGLQEGRVVLDAPTRTLTTRDLEPIYRARQAS